MTIIELFDSLKGTAHYFTCMEIAVNKAMSTIPGNRARLTPADNLDSEKFNGSDEAKKSLAKKNTSSTNWKSWKEKGVVADDELIDHTTGVRLGINDETATEGGLKVKGYYSKEELDEMRIPTFGWTGISTQDYERVHPATSIYEYLRLLKNATRGEKVSVNNCRFIVKSSKISLQRHMNQKHLEVAKVDASVQTFAQNENSQTTLSMAS